MKLKINLLLALTLGFAFSNGLFAQKKGEKTVLFFKYTFDKFGSDEVEISEPGGISLLKGLKPSTSFPADAFAGTGDFGVGANLYGYALPIDPKNEKFEGDDKNIYVSTDDLKDGNLAYAGIVTYKPGKLQKEKSFVTIPFMGPKSNKLTMIKGKKYCVELSISLAEASKYATNNIGLMFVKDPNQYQVEVGETEDAGPINAEESRIMYNYKNKVYDSYSGWDKICGIYTAKGDETAVVIGNFLINDKTTAVQQKKIMKPEIDAATGEKAIVPPLAMMAYYYIDNLRIKEVDNKNQCNCIKVDSSASSVVYSTVVVSKEPVLSDKMTEEEKVAAQVIYYAFGKAKPGEVGKSCINYVGDYLKSNPTKSLVIYAHNDEVEDSLATTYEDLREELENLDEQRGNYIKTRLVEIYGVSEDRIRIIAENAAKPSDEEIDDPDDRELKMAYNRRVIFEIQ